MEPLTTIGLYINSSRDEGYTVTNQVARYIGNRGRKIMLCGDDTALAEINTIEIAKAEEVQCLLCLGGDGTLLRAVKTAAPVGTPVMGLNLGKLGYLTDAPAVGYEQALDRMMAGGFKIERRIMLEALWEGGSALALNDILIGSGSPKLLTLRVEINGDHMDTYQADGVLVSTPTGSTAYNLSAGGPIIKPDADILAITPVCPHALHVRNAVISSSDQVMVTVMSEPSGFIYADGETVIGLNPGQPVLIRKSLHFALIIKTGNDGFYDILREKMNWR